MTRVFISYSHKDEALRAELDTHLALLRREGAIDVWSDHRIAAGSELDASISDALESADIILLLLSADFIASDYCFGIEMRRAIERHERREAVVVPVLLRPCDFRTAPFGRLKAIPTDARPVVKWPNRDDAFLDIVHYLRALLPEPAAQSRGPSRPPAATSPNTGSQSTPSAATDSAPSRRAPRSSDLFLPREFTDQDKHDFVQRAFEYIRNYFEGSLEELAIRNAGITSRLASLSPRAFSAVVFRNGKRIGGCSVRLGSALHAGGISFSHDENAGESSSNEILTVESDEHTMHLKPLMGWHGDRTNSKLSEEGAAEHLWSMFKSTLR